MPFVEDMEIPPIFVKILKKIEEKGQVNIDEFKTIILNLRINKEDCKEIQSYLIKNKLIQRIPSLEKIKEGGAKDVIILTKYKS
jgi:hypothetical protein